MFTEPLTLEEFAERFLAKAEDADPWKDDYAKDARVPRLARVLRGVTARGGKVGLLGAGSFGTAAALDDKLVVKLTTDASEIQAGAVLVGKALPHVTRIYGSYFTKDVYVRVAVAWDAFKEEKIFSNERAGVLLLERVTPIDQSQRVFLSKIVNAFKSEWQLYPAQLMALPQKEQRVRLKKASEELERVLRNTSGERKLLDGVADALRELREVGVFAIDVHGGNVGSANGVYKVFDIGSSSPPMKPKAKIFGAAEGMVEGRTAPVWDETGAEESARLSHMQAPWEWRVTFTRPDGKNYMPVFVMARTNEEAVEAARQGFMEHNISTEGLSVRAQIVTHVNPQPVREDMPFVMDFPNENFAVDAAIKQGATHYLRNDRAGRVDLFRPYSPGPGIPHDDTFERADAYKHAGKWHVSAWIQSDNGGGFDLPKNAEPIPGAGSPERRAHRGGAEERANVIYEGGPLRWEPEPRVEGFPETWLARGSRDYEYRVYYGPKHKHPGWILLNGPRGTCHLAEFGFKSKEAAQKAAQKLEDGRAEKKPAARPEPTLAKLNWKKEGKGWRARVSYTLGAHTMLGIYEVRPVRSHFDLFAQGVVGGGPRSLQWIGSFKTREMACQWAETDAATHVNACAREVVPVAREASSYTTLPRDPAEAAAGKALGQMRGPLDVHRACRAMWDESQEVFIVLPVSVHGEPLCPPIEIARGQRDQVNINFEDVWRAVAAKNGAGYYICHNHPSSHCEPSPQDRDLTDEIKRRSAEALPSVAFLDHVVITREECYSILGDEAFRAA